jgi:hypothetical protein
MDSVAIIAASSKVDISFVMTLQTIRFLIILFIGPHVARIVARRMEASMPAASTAARVRLPQNGGEQGNREKEQG